MVLGRLVLKRGVAQAVKREGHAADIALQPIFIDCAGSTPICNTRGTAGCAVAPAAADGDFAERAVILIVHQDGYFSVPSISTAKG